VPFAENIGLMEALTVRQLRPADAETLLAFERENREWFETHIEARPPAFYCLAGISAHIETYLDGLATGTWAPFVLLDASGQMVGRANLKHIDTQRRCAEVGYRIARHACGQGLATRALEHLIEQARVRWGLRELVAFVYEENVGSRKVLGRCGFTLAQPDATGDAGPELRFTRAL